MVMGARSERRQASPIVRATSRESGEKCDVRRRRMLGENTVPSNRVRLGYYLGRVTLQIEKYVRLFLCFFFGRRPQQHRDGPRAAHRSDLRDVR